MKKMLLIALSTFVINLSVMTLTKTDSLAINEIAIVENQPVFDSWEDEPFILSEAPRPFAWVSALKKAYENLYKAPSDSGYEQAQKGAKQVDAELHKFLNNMKHEVSQGYSYPIRPSEIRKKLIGHLDELITYVREKKLKVSRYDLFLLKKARSELEAYPGGQKSFARVLSLVDQYVNQVATAQGISVACVKMLENKSDIVDLTTALAGQVEGIYALWKSRIQQQHDYDPKKDTFINSKITKEQLQKIINDAKYTAQISTAADVSTERVLGVVFPAYKAFSEERLNMLSWSAWSGRMIGFGLSNKAKDLQDMVDKVIRLCVAYPFTVSDEVAKNVFELIEENQKYKRALQSDAYKRAKDTIRYIMGQEIMRSAEETDRIYIKLTSDLMKDAAAGTFGEKLIVTAAQLEPLLDRILQPIENALAQKVKELYGIDLFALQGVDSLKIPHLVLE